MPVYEYKCGECGSTYDVYHKREEILEDVVCPRCSSTDHKKLMSASAVSTKAGSRNEPSCASGDCCGGTCGLD